MKPFNLERALAGDPVVTRDGQKIIEIIHFKKRNKFPVLALFDYENTIKAYCENGIYCNSLSECDNKYDLFMAPKTKKLWIAIEKAEHAKGSHFTSTAETDKEYLLKHIDKKKYHIVEVEIEE